MPAINIPEHNINRKLFQESTSKWLGTSFTQCSCPDDKKAKT